MRSSPAQARARDNVAPSAMRVAPLPLVRVAMCPDPPSVRGRERLSHRQVPGDLREARMGRYAFARIPRSEDDLRRDAQPECEEEEQQQRPGRELTTHDQASDGIDNNPGPPPAGGRTRVPNARHPLGQRRSGWERDRAVLAGSGSGAGQRGTERHARCTSPTDRRTLALGPSGCGTPSASPRSEVRLRSSAARYAQAGSAAPARAACPATLAATRRIKHNTNVRLSDRPRTIKPPSGIGSRSPLGAS